MKAADIHWVYQQNLSSVMVSLPPQFEGTTQRHFLSSDRKSLTIIDVQFSDGGFYTITAKNSVAENNSTIMLQIYGKHWKKKRLNIYRIAGFSTRI